jgi:hypothetical protein
MTEQQINLSARLKRLGLTKGNQMKLYGEVFEVVKRANPYGGQRSTCGRNRAEVWAV